MKHILDKFKQEKKTDFEAEVDHSSTSASQEEHKSTLETNESQGNSMIIEDTDSQMELTEDSCESENSQDSQEIETEPSISGESLREKGITLLPSEMSSEEELLLKE